MTPVFVQRLLQRAFDTAEFRERLLKRWGASVSLPFSKPFITIARDPGSGGKPIGQEVARRLGFQFYDQELIDEIAKSAKLRRDVLQKLDEKSRTVMQDFIQGLLNPNYVSDVTFVKHMTNVIVSLAIRGDAVILGRGACFVTPREKGLHIRITAPLPERIRRAIEFEHVSPSQAKEIVHDVGKDRRDFVKQYFGADLRNSDYYDLVLNTQNFAVEDSVDLIIRAFERKFPKQTIF